MLSELSSLLLHALLLLPGLLFKVKVSETHILIEHELAFSPLSESLSIILGLVTLEIILDLANVVQREVIETELKVNQGVVETSGLLEQLSALLIHIVIAEVQRKHMLVLVKTLNKDD